MCVLDRLYFGEPLHSNNNDDNNGYLIKLTRSCVEIQAFENTRQGTRKALAFEKMETHHTDGGTLACQVTELNKKVIALFTMSHHCGIRMMLLHHITMNQVCSVISLEKLHYCIAFELYGDVYGAN